MTHPLNRRYRKTVHQALAPFGFDYTNTGGSCTAYTAELSDGVTAHLTAHDAPDAPVTMRQRCDLAVYASLTDKTVFLATDVPLADIAARLYRIVFPDGQVSIGLT